MNNLKPVKKEMKRKQIKVHKHASEMQHFSVTVVRFP